MAQNEHYSMTLSIMAQKWITGHWEIFQIADWWWLLAILKYLYFRRSLHSSGSNSPYRHPVGSPHSTHSNGTHHSMETTNGSMSNGDSKLEHNGNSSCEKNGDTTPVASELNGNSNNHLTDPLTQENCAVVEDMGRWYKGEVLFRMYLLVMGNTMVTLPT